MYDPIDLLNKVTKEVIRIEGGEELRAYFRFRRDRWYGGIVTGDVIGCNLRCRFCWAYYFTWGLKLLKDKVMFLSPHEVASRLIALARKYGLKQARLSGGEPTIGFNHMIKVTKELIENGVKVVIETNGLLIGMRKDYAKELASFSNDGIEIRISIKGASPKEFELLTGANGKYWWVQINALENLVNYGLRPGDEVYPAVMLSFSNKESYEELIKLLRSISKEFVESLDEEYVIMYDHVKKLLRRYGLVPKKYFTPNNIPKEMI